jgi:hypothetical protein
MRKTVLVLFVWTAAVATWAVLNGGRIAPCFGGGSGPTRTAAELDCVARWQAANPPPPAPLDPALPWFLLGWLVGCLVVLAVARLVRR